MNTTSTVTLDHSALQASVGPQMTEVEARRIFSLGPDAVVFVMMEMARRLTEANSNRIDPATPSAQIPAYSKIDFRTLSRRSKHSAKW